MSDQKSKRQVARSNRTQKTDPGPRRKCVDLRERFGREYRVEHEESLAAEKPALRAEEAIWLRVIPGRLGDVCPWDENRLLAQTHRAGKTASLLRSLPYAAVWTDGDDGVSVVFPVEKLAEVAAILKSRRRRRLGPAARERLVEVGAKTRFRNGTRVDSKARPQAPNSRSDSRAVRRRKGLVAP